MTNELRKYTSDKLNSDSSLHCTGELSSASVVDKVMVFGSPLIVSDELICWSRLHIVVFGTYSLVIIFNEHIKYMVDFKRLIYKLNINTLWGKYVKFL